MKNSEIIHLIQAVLLAAASGQQPQNTASIPSDLSVRK
jgi:hypothetical protein